MRNKIQRRKRSVNDHEIFFFSPFDEICVPVYFAALKRPHTHTHTHKHTHIHSYTHTHTHTHTYIHTHIPTYLYGHTNAQIHRRVQLCLLSLCRLLLLSLSRRFCPSSQKATATNKVRETVRDNIGTYTEGILCFNQWRFDRRKVALN